MRDPPALVELASRQHWVVTRRQLRRLGISPFTIRGRLERGLWVEHLGALVLRPTANGTAIQDAHAIALQLPSGGGVSGATALGFWGKPCDGPRTPSALLGLPRLAVVPHTTKPRIGSVRVLRLNDIHARSIVSRRGVMVRAFADALLDLITVLSAATAQALLDHALQRHWIDPSALSRAAGPRLGGGRRGAQVIRRLVEQAGGGTHSEAERRMAELLQKSRIRGWTANYPLRGPSGIVVAELDFAWPKERIYLEVDGWEHHSDREAFVSDRVRQNALSVGRWLPLRATWEMITRDKHLLIKTVRAALREARSLDKSASGASTSFQSLG